MARSRTLGHRSPVPPGGLSGGGSLRRRTEHTLILFILVGLALAGRLGYLMAYKGSYFATKATRQQHRVHAISAKRGRILARQGEILARDLVAKDIVANPRVVEDKAKTARTVARLLGGDQKLAARLQKRLERSQGYFVYLKRQVPAADADLLERNLEQPELKGVRTEETFIRSKPAEGIAANVVGWTDPDGKGLAGIEWRYDTLLTGRPGERDSRVDALGDVIPHTERITQPPRNGEDVRLTLDTTIQQIADAALDTCAGQYHPASAVAVVMDVRTGEMLALSNYPRWNPLTDRKLDMSRRRIRAVADIYEPGSTFKPLIAAAALEAGVRTDGYCTGSRTIGRYTIHCAHHAHGQTDLRKMVRASCNLGAAQIAERLGSRRLYEYAGKFGLLEPTNIELKEESTLPLPEPKDKGWPLIKVWNIGFGQGIALNAVQLIAAYGALANEGIYNPPQLVLSVGGRPAPKRPTHRVCSPQTAKQVLSFMEDVVTARGTAPRAKVKYYTTGGKTGTAQIVEKGRYVPGAYAASFVGVIPARAPRLAILVTVFRPHGARYGGTVAAPVFREIAEQTVRYLEIPPDAPDDPRDGANPASY